MEKDLILPQQDKLPLQGSMFIGEKGKLLLPHSMQEPSLIVKGEYKKIDISKYPEAFKLKSKNPNMIQAIGLEVICLIFVIYAFLT